MNQKDFPSLFIAADHTSIKTQSLYTWLMAIDLCLMILAAAFAIYNFQEDEIKVWLYLISGAFLIVGLIITVILKTKRYEDSWYQGRALAESVKTLTWRFMTCSESFENALSLDDARNKFLSRIRELSEKYTDLNKLHNATQLALPTITDRMIQVRNSSLEERKSFYLEHRIKDQKDWYAAKAEFNKGREDSWFIAILSFQFFSLIAILILITAPGSNWNLVGLFTTLSSASLSWLQLKRHQENKQAYTTATQELSLIEESSVGISSETGLSEFVLDAENAISREHTLWLAQKR